MSYSLKVTGITEIKKDLKNYRDLIRETVKNNTGKKVMMPVPSLGVNLVLPDIDNIQNPLKTLEKQVQKAHTRACRLMADEFGRALDDAMESPVWDWKGDKRDIVDTGRLKESKKIIVDSDGDIHVLYNTKYAALVHYGGYFHPYGNENAKVYYPGRPWVTSLIKGGGPVEQFNFGRVYGVFFIAEIMELI